MSKTWQRVVLALLAIVTCVATVAIAQQVLPNQQRVVGQTDPPGYALTTQTAFCQTSTGGAQANTITVAGLAGKTIYVTGFEITGSGATAASDIAITLASGGTTQANYTLPVIAGATLIETPLIVEFTTPVSGLAVGNNAVLTVPSFGSGNTAASVTLHGYYE